MLCIVFVLTFFEGICANSNLGVPTAQKQFAVHEILPPSLLYLLHTQPIRRSRPLQPVALPFTSQNAASTSEFRPNLPSAPTKPFAPLPPVAPVAPVPPTPPFVPVAPVPPTPPFIPSAPVWPTTPGLSPPTAAKPTLGNNVLPSSVLYLLNQPIRHPHSGQPKLRTQEFSPLPYSDLYPSLETAQRLPVKENNYQNTGQLSYDDLSNGNRKILNVVHIPLRSTVSKQPIPAPASLIGPQLNNTPIGPAPLPPKVSTVSKPEDLSPVPSNTIGALPVPAKPDLANNDNTNTFNLKDLPYTPIGNIEASPIPIKQNDKITGEIENTAASEELSPTSNQTREQPQIPSKPTDAIDETKGDGINSSVSSQDELEESKIDPNERDANSDISDKGHSINSNADSSQTQKTNNNTLKDSSEKSKEPQNPLGNLILNDVRTSPELEPSNNEIENNSNPLGNLILNGTSSDNNENSQAKETEDNPLKDVIINDAPTESTDNPLRDLILNDTPSDSTSNDNETEKTGNPLSGVILNGTLSDDNKAAEEPYNPLKDLIVNDKSSNENSPSESQDNPLKDLIVNDTSNKTKEVQSESTTESSNEDQSKSLQENDEETNENSSQGSHSSNNTEAVGTEESKPCTSGESDASTQQSQVNEESS